MSVTALFTTCPAGVVLSDAIEADLDRVIVIGWHKGDADQPMYTSVNFEDGPTALWLLEQAKLTLLKGEKS